jgi:hypothetical protein
MLARSTASRAFISIHDVMPETLDRVLGLIEVLAGHEISSCDLLVVPGRDWSADQIARLRGLAESGFRLAGHGWSHRIRRRTSVYHRLHSQLLSRDVAEHLSLSPDEIAALVSRCAQWFDEHQLPRSELYVPPAWALGRIPSSRLAATGFRLFETVTGVLDAASGHHRMLPLVGFEADTALRAITLRSLNRLNIALARATGRPLRVGLHPHDLELKLHRAIPPLLAGCTPQELRLHHQRDRGPQSNGCSDGAGPTAALGDH